MVYIKRRKGSYQVVYLICVISVLMGSFNDSTVAKRVYTQDMF